MVNSKLRRHKVMEKVIKKLMANNLPPSFKFKDTYDSIEVPTAYQQHVPTQQEIEDEFDSMLAEEEALPTVTMDIEDLDIISTNVYSNTTTGRIGIGTANPSGTLHVHSTDSIVVPSGTTAQRSQTPVNGMLRYNTETGYFETYTVSGWGSLATPPSIASFTPTVVDTGGFSTITVTGSFFDQNSSIKLRGSDGTEYSTTSFSFTSTTSISATLPSLPSTKSPYTVVVTAGSGLSTESTDTLVSGNTPVWSSPAAGANVSSSSTITLSATDADGDTLTYSIVSGTLPGGLTLSGNQISGTSTATAGSTSTITVRASDGDLYADRTFNIVEPLYAFTSHTFTNAGAVGIDGPTLTQCRNAYNVTWDGDTSLFNVVTRGIQEWTVPDTGTYRIEAWGGSAGRTKSWYGGRGAVIIADVTLTLGEVIKILVGQGGTSKGDDCNAGAGGGTFVVRSPYNTNASILVIAGGGGGTARTSGLDAVTTIVGGASSAGTAGGSNGQGGGQNQGPSGAGFFGNGAAASWGGLGGVNDGIAQAFVNGGQGGSSTHQTPNVLGGFGGGASGHGNCCIGGGGGGGYGGGGGTISCQAGGGGSCYIISSATNVKTSNGMFDGSYTFNGQSITNLNQWNSYASSATSGAFAPSGKVIITKI